MKNTFSLEQISKTGSLDSNLITREYKLDLMARFMGIKSMNPKLRQDQIAKEIGFSSSTLQRYRNDKNMPSPYRIPQNNTNKRRQKSSNTNLDDNSNCEHEVQRRQMTSLNLKLPLNVHLTREKIFFKLDPYIKILKLTMII